MIYDKWIAALSSRFAMELSHVKASIVTNVQALANRYAKPLPEAEKKVEELRAKVADHLSAMGIKI